MSLLPLRQLVKVSGDHVSDDHYRPNDVAAFFDSF